MYFLLFYEFTDDYIERRRAFREEHLELAREAKERGELVLAALTPTHPMVRRWCSEPMTTQS